MAGTPKARRTRQKGKTNILHSNEQDIINVLHNHQQKQSEKASARVAAFQERKRSLYAHARQRGRSISTSGLAYIEEMQASYQQLREKENPSHSFIQDYMGLKQSQEDILRMLPELCSELVDVLSLRRTSQVDSACEMVRNGHESRQEALNTALRNARKELERVKENERVSSDAVEMINYYKELLRLSSADAW